MPKPDTRLEEWIEQYGEITTYSFMIYGHYGLRDNAIICQGLTMALLHQGLENIRYIQIVEDVDGDTAKMYGTKRGINIQWIFPQKRKSDFDEMIISTISDGLTHLSIKFEFYGRFG